MARLIVEATPGREQATLTEGEMIWSLQVAVSVSRADDGSPVTGLAQESFRVSFMGGNAQDVALMGEFKEHEWEPQDVEGSGLYLLSLTPQGDITAYAGHRFTFCVQARTFQGGQVVDQGQGLAVVVPVPPGD
jgi:hypothetical protein